MTEVLGPSVGRLTELFLALTRLASPSKRERAVADLVISTLEAVGVKVHEDDAGAKTGGDAGNLWCVVRPDRSVAEESADEVPHVALGAHLDTVAPTEAVEPYLDDDKVFRNRRRTILGADDKVAVCALLHATELLKSSGRAFPPYELFFTVAEEIGLVGAKHFASAVLASPFAVVLDSSGPVGGITVRAPSQQSLKATFRGRAAHAGVEPERGRSAIQAAARAIAAMSLGRVDEESSANIGVIKGGVASNIVPDLCELQGECRSHDEEKLARIAASMVDAIQEGASRTGVDVDVSLTHEYRAFALHPRAAVVRLCKAALAELGLEARLLTGGGGSDANILNARGLPTVNLDAGMMQVHSPEEYVTLQEIEKLCALVLRIIELAPGFAPPASSRSQIHD
jgi:tripeptide aminopeptidase